MTGRGDSDAVYAVLRDAEPGVLDREGLAELTSQIAVHRAWLDGLQVRTARRQRELAAEGRGEQPKDLFTRHGQSGKDARAADERERVCSSMPGFEHALGAGGVSSGHVDAIAQATRNLDDEALAEFVANGEGLLGDAGRQGVDVFEKTCRDLARLIVATKPGNAEVDELDRQRAASKISRWVDKATGMRHTRIELDPIRDAKLWAAIDRQRARLRREAGDGKRSWDQLQVEALLAAVSNTGEPGQKVIEMSVLVDYETLVNGLHDNGVCELADGTALPVATVRQLACEAEIIPIVLNGQGLALDVGRSARLATAAQRLALQAMHTTCAFPGCDVPVEECEAHHFEWFSRGGRTDLKILVPVCETKGHHTLVHEGGWNLTLTDDRIATITRLDGSIYYQGPIITRAPNGVGRVA